MTPGRDRGRSATPSGRPFTGSEWDFSASPALEPVRAGSRGNPSPRLAMESYFGVLFSAQKDISDNFRLLK
jgi:hypothetical protein